MSSRTQFPEIFGGLANPFDASDVRLLPKGGKQFPFITARTVMNRLDEILGPENWEDSYKPNEHSVECRLTITLPDGKRITKTDAGAYSGMADEGDDDKSGYSDAFKRAAVKFGVGRYLYGQGCTGYDGQSQPAISSPTRDSQTGHSSENSQNGQANRVPRTGRALFAWTKDMEQRHEVGLLKFLNGWAKAQGFPDRMVDWNEDEVKLAHAEAVRKLDFIQRGQNDQPRSEPPKPARMTRESFGEPNGDIPCPSFGKELYDSTKQWEQTLGVTLVPACTAFAREQGIAGRFTDWAGDDLDLVWRFLSARVAGIQAKASKPRVPELNRKVWDRAKKLVGMIWVNPSGKDSEIPARRIMDEINTVYCSIYQGEVIESFRDFRDDVRLKELLETLDMLIAEQAELSTSNI